MKLPFHIIELLKRKSENGLRLPSDCELLSLDIQSKTGVRIGATTLKRLLGFAQDERQPHTSTLDAIACYLGYAHWDELTSTLDAIACYLGYAHWDELAKIEDEGNSDFNNFSDELRSDSLQRGDSVQVTYLPDRQLLFEYQGNDRYLVVESLNSKLRVGDEVEIQNFILHHPLLVARVWRDGDSLGQYTAGRVSGLSSIKVMR